MQANPSRAALLALVNADLAGAAMSGFRLMAGAWGDILALNAKAVQGVLS
jgi:hypothetical protein